MINNCQDKETQLFPYSGAAAYLRSRGVVLAEQTLRRKVCEGVLPCVRLGGRTYLQKVTLDQWIERSHVPASRGPLTDGVNGDDRGN